MVRVALSMRNLGAYLSRIMLSRSSSTATPAPRSSIAPLPPHSEQHYDPGSSLVDRSAPSSLRAALRPRLLARRSLRSLLTQSSTATPAAALRPRQQHCNPGSSTTTPAAALQPRQQHFNPDSSTSTPTAALQPRQQHFNPGSSTSTPAAALRQQQPQKLNN